MQATIKKAAVTNEQATKFQKRIGSTVYNVSVHFSQSNTETLEDKLYRLIESEVKKIA